MIGVTKNKPAGWFTGVVNLENFAVNYHNLTGLDVYLSLDKEHARTLVKKLLTKMDCSIHHVDVLVGNQKKSSLRHLCEGYKVSFNDYQNLLSALGENIDYSKIKAIAAKHGAFGNFNNLVKNPEIPFDFRSEEGVRLIASLLHDGGITKTLIPHFTSITPELRVAFVKNMSSIFGEIKNRRSNPDTGECVFFPKVIGTALVYGLGLKFGTRSIKDASIPEFIFNLDKKLRRAFISQAIDEDGTFDMSQKQNRIAIHHAKQINSNGKSRSKLLWDTKKLFVSLGVKVWGPSYHSTYITKRGEIRQRWIIRVCKTEIKKVWNNINLIIPFKQKRLLQVANS